MGKLLAHMMGSIQQIGPSPNGDFADLYDKISPLRQSLILVQMRTKGWAGLDSGAEGTPQTNIRNDLDVNQYENRVEANQQAGKDQQPSSGKEVLEKSQPPIAF